MKNLKEFISEFWVEIIIVIVVLVLMGFGQIEAAQNFIDFIESFD